MGGCFGRLRRAVLRQEVGDGDPYQDLGSPDDVDREAWFRLRAVRDFWCLGPLARELALPWRPE